MKNYVLGTVVLAMVLDPGRAAAGGVVLLSSADLPPYVATAMGFRAAYRGTTAGVQLDTRDSSTIRQCIVDADPEVIVALGAPAARFAHERFPHTPLVYALVHDPARHGIEGVRVTGISSRVSDQSQIDALRRIAPEVRRLARVRGIGAAPATMRQAREAAAAAGIQLVDVPVATAGEVSVAIRGVTARVDAVWLPADPALAAPEVFQFLLQWSLERRRPMLVFSEALVRAGALVAVAPDYAWVGAQAADLVRRIRGGERPADIPVTELRRTRVAVNSATGRALGLDPATIAEMERLSGMTPVVAP